MQEVGDPGISLAGVLGFPVAHSRSPQIQNAAFRATGLDWRYVKLPVPPALFPETVRALPGSGFRGANVTIPHKRAALDLADERTPSADAIGAANTLTFLEHGGIEAHNTDAPGFLAALGEDARGLSALVLGAGGAARAVVWALKQAGAAEIAVWNRTPERAKALAAELGVEQILRPASCDLLVNATSVGLAPRLDEAATLRALQLDELDPPPLVADLVYGAEHTPLLEWAARGGSRTVDGLEVLVRQGALSFERWTGLDAPIQAMRAAAVSR
ncbi:MAG TPA: shikimate dehydrogenase [Thermoleophilaceae bacterium]